MKKIILGSLAFTSLLVSSLAFAQYTKRIEVYKVVSVSAEAADGWTTLNTATGLDVYVRCKTADFDDAFHDRVGGFVNEKECREFLSDLVKTASAATPVGIQIGPDFTILIEKVMKPNHDECGTATPGSSPSSGSKSQK